MSKLAQDIKKIKAAIASPATPDNIKETMKKKLVELEAKLADEEKPVDQPVEKSQKSMTEDEHRKFYESLKAGDIISFNLSSVDPKKKGTIEEDQHLGRVVNVDGKQYELKRLMNIKLISKAEKPTPAKPSTDTDLDCEELIKKAKASAKKRKAARAKAEAKPESKKNVERVEKAADTVVSSIEKRIASGEKVNASEVEKLIAEYEANIKELKRLLAKLK